MRKKVIAANWKLNKTIGEAVKFTTLLKRENFGDDAPEIILCPSFTCLSAVYDAIGDSDIKLGGQDLYWEDKGAFTGEVSGVMLKDAGCEFVIIGHSERRQFFGETDATVNKKIQSALSLGLTPIVCVGESLKEREAEKTNAVLEKQVKGAFAGISPEDAAGCYIAYEPVWAIGTGKVATPEQAQEAQKFIRDLVGQLYFAGLSQELPILYGGSVKPENAAELMRQPDVDGALVGGASLEVASLAGIVRGAQAQVVS
jgi:triosephosphate isomerase